MVSPHGTDSSRDWRRNSAPATLMRLAAGAGREAQERKSIVRQCRAELYRQAIMNHELAC